MGIRVHFTFIALLALTFVPAAGAEGAKKAAKEADVCEIRPDLCGQTARKKKKSRKTAKHAKKKKIKCREAGEDPSVDEADLPICGDEASMAASEIEQDLGTRNSRSNPYGGSGNAHISSGGGSHSSSSSDMGFGNSSSLGSYSSGSSGSRRSPSNVGPSFDSYMQSNNTHPAISGRTKHQAAFQPVVRRNPEPEASGSAGTGNGTVAAGTGNGVAGATDPGQGTANQAATNGNTPPPDFLNLQPNGQQATSAK